MSNENNESTRGGEGRVTLDDICDLLNAKEHNNTTDWSVIRWADESAHVESYHDNKVLTEFEALAIYERYMRPEEERLKLWQW